MNKTDDMYIKKLKEELAECRKHLAESVCRECKCEVNTSVNHDLVKENLRLREAVEFYADKENRDIYSKIYGSDFSAKARQVLEKIKE